MVTGIGIGFILARGCLDRSPIRVVSPRGIRARELDVAHAIVPGSTRIRRFS